MKFNIDAFKRFNKYVNTPEKVKLYTLKRLREKCDYSAYSLFSACVSQ